MASHISAVKRAKQNSKRRARNASVSSEMKTSLKKAVEAIKGAKSKEEALKLLSTASKILQSAASKKVIPKTRASRSLSRIAQSVNSQFAK